MNEFFYYLLKVPDYNGFIICLSVAGIFLLLIISRWLKIIDFMKNSEVVEGKILRMRLASDNEEEYPTVAFKTLYGQYVERESKVPLGAGIFGVNQTIKVRYSTQDPYNFKLNNRWGEHVEMIFLAVFMAIAIGVGLLFLFD